MLDLANVQSYVQCTDFVSKQLNLQGGHFQSFNFKEGHVPLVPPDSYTYA